MMSPDYASDYAAEAETIRYAERRTKARAAEATARHISNVLYLLRMDADTTLTLGDLRNATRNLVDFARELDEMAAEMQAEAADAADEARAHYGTNE